jgi:pantoate kinase
MIYCPARKGVMEYKTQFSTQFDRYVESVRASVQLPIGVGFGIQSQAAISLIYGPHSATRPCRFQTAGQTLSTDLDSAPDEEISAYLCQA